MDYIHELRQQIGSRKIILNAATTIIEKDEKSFSNDGRTTASGV